MPLSLFAEDQLDRDLVESEFGTNGIDQIALIGKMNATGVGDKKDECGRFHAGLRRVRDAHGFILKTGHRVFPDAFFHQIV